MRTISAFYFYFLYFFRREAEVLSEPCVILRTPQLKGLFPRCFPKRPGTLCTGTDKRRHHPLRSMHPLGVTLDFFADVTRRMRIRGRLNGCSVDRDDSPIGHFDAEAAHVRTIQRADRQDRTSSSRSHRRIVGLRHPLNRVGFVGSNLRHLRTRFGGTRPRLRLSPPNQVPRRQTRPEKTTPAARGLISNEGLLLST